MSGAWAKACDAEDELFPEKQLERAAFLIATALIDDVVDTDQIVRAGAYLRAYRKSLDVQGKRWPARDEALDRRVLLWSALRFIASYSRWGHASDLRIAEAYLRTYWKQPDQRGRVSALRARTGRMGVADRGRPVSAAMEKFASIVNHGNRGHGNIPYPDSWIECADGTRLSVICGGGTYCHPRPALCACPYTDPHPPVLGEVQHDYPGPYTHVEVMVAPEPDGWDQYEAGGVYAAVPVELVRAFIAEHDGADR